MRKNHFLSIILCFNLTTLINLPETKVFNFTFNLSLFRQSFKTLRKVVVTFPSTFLDNLSSNKTSQIISISEKNQNDMNSLKMNLNC